MRAHRLKVGSEMLVEVFADDPLHLVELFVDESVQVIEVTTIGCLDASFLNFLNAVLSSCTNAVNNGALKLLENFSIL